jgi:hypothetical protein
MLLCDYDATSSGISLGDPSSFIINSERLKHTAEFVEAMETNDLERWGVLLSGPAGVGKSAICALTFLTCFARGLPVCYIAASAEWVCQTDTDEEARRFFMDLFFMQNADIIADDDTLRPFFQEQLDGHPPDPRQYVRLSKALKSGKTKTPCGMIIDDSHYLRREHHVEVLDKSTGRSHYELSSRTPFTKDFTIWTGKSSAFRSQLSATGHGPRELELAATNDEHRLRVVQPIGPDDARMLLTSPMSSLYRGLALAKVSEKVISITGGMAQQFFDVVNKVPMGLTDKGKMKDIIEQFEWGYLFWTSDAAKREWIEKRDNRHMETTMAKLLSIIEDKVIHPIHPMHPKREKPRLSLDLKPLYDHGLLICGPEPDSRELRATSALATWLLLGFHSNYYKSEAAEGLNDYGPEQVAYRELFRRQVIACLPQFSDKFGCTVLARSLQDPLNASKNRAIRIGVSRARTFTDLSEITRDDTRWTLWFSRSNDECACDGIIVPPKSLRVDLNPIVVMDTSVSNPYDDLSELKDTDASVQAILKFHKKGVAPVAAHFGLKPGRVVGLCFYDKAVPQMVLDQASTLAGYPLHVYATEEKECRGIGVKYE